MKTLDQSNTATLARQLMAQHGVPSDWTFGYDRAKRRAGRCCYRKKAITLSIHLVARNSDEEIKDCLLHEIAHCLAGPGTHHGPDWKAVCRRVGAKPVRCYNINLVDMPKGRYRATCGGCQKTYYRHRFPRCSYYYCTICGPGRGRLLFTEGGRTALEEVEAKLSQFLREALDRTQGVKLSENERHTAAKVCIQYGIKVERVKELLAGAVEAKVTLLFREALDRSQGRRVTENDMSAAVKLGIQYGIDEERLKQLLREASR